MMKTRPQAYLLLAAFALCICAAIFFFSEFLGRNRSVTLNESQQANLDTVTVLAGEVEDLRSQASIHAGRGEHLEAGYLLLAAATIDNSLSRHLDDGTGLRDKPTNLEIAALRQFQLHDSEVRYSDFLHQKYPSWSLE